MLCQIDYGVSQANLQKLDRVQNEAMRVILGTIKGMPIEAMQYMLVLPSMLTRQNVAQIKGTSLRKPEQIAVKGKKGNRLTRGKSWMGQMEDLIQEVWELTELKQSKDW